MQGPEKLRRWCEVETEGKQTLGAARVGVSQSLFGKWLRGQAVPNRVNQKRIHGVTGGYISANDWMLADPPVAAEAEPKAQPQGRAA